MSYGSMLLQDAVGKTVLLVLSVLSTVGTTLTLWLMIRY